jgi:phage replication O-like protein O
MTRVPYAAAGDVYREALARAVAHAGDLRARDWRVLLACLALTTSYSKTDDRVRVGQVVALSGVPRAKASESLHRLHDLGVIEWRPSRGPRGSFLNVGTRF